jgi:hypothetical protein
MTFSSSGIWQRHMVFKNLTNPIIVAEGHQFVIARPVNNAKHFSKRENTAVLSFYPWYSMARSGWRSQS